MKTLSMNFALKKGLRLESISQFFPFEYMLKREAKILISAISNTYIHTTDKYRVKKKLYGGIKKVRTRALGLFTFKGMDFHFSDFCNVRDAILCLYICIPVCR